MMDRRQLCASAVTAALNVVFCASAVAGEIRPISFKAQRLAAFYDGLDVEQRWRAGLHINWETGLPDGGRVSVVGKHTHCSAFVGSVSKRLGIYLLRPPEHGQLLLANAQIDWLAGSSATLGWQSVADAISAQDAANDGCFVVASYRAHDSTRPGHIAIVRPGTRSAADVETQGPDIIQAGLENYSRTTVAIGFAGHPLAWAKGREIRFFAHEWDGRILPTT